MTSKDIGHVVRTTSFFGGKLYYHCGQTRRREDTQRVSARHEPKCQACRKKARKHGIKV